MKSSRALLKRPMKSPAQWKRRRYTRYAMPAHESAQYSPNPTLEPGARVGFSQTTLTGWKRHDTTAHDTTGHDTTGQDNWARHDTTAWTTYVGLLNSIQFRRVLSYLYVCACVQNVIKLLNLSVTHASFRHNFRNGDPLELYEFPDFRCISLFENWRKNSDF